MATRYVDRGREEIAVHPIARIVRTFEMIVGVLFITVLIARLAGSYPLRER